MIISLSLHVHVYVGSSSPQRGYWGFPPPICDRICENPTLPGFIDFVLEAIIVTKQHFGENAVITATGEQTYGLQDIGV